MTTTGTHYWKVAKATDRQGVFRSVAGSPRQEYEIGKMYALEGGQTPELCERGFHACRDARMLMMLMYLYGYDKEDVLLKVLLGGTRLTDGEISVASEITILGVTSWDDAIAERSGAPYVNSCNGDAYTFDEKGRLRYRNTVNGKEQWFRNGVLHRDGDQPAVRHGDGSLEWWVDGKRHRVDDKPAVQWADGTLEWYVDGKLHREGDQPAVVRANGNREWWFKGKRHREHDKPAAVQANGDQQWWVDDWRHRADDKPAVVKADGDLEWWVDGKRHRTDDKPAVVRASGDLEWWVNAWRHRADDKPAVVRVSGDLDWWVNDRRHREGHKPALMRANGLQWWVDGRLVESRLLPICES